MSKLYACVGKKADKPYYPLRGRAGVRTMEELCYYICMNRTILDYSFMKEQLALFIKEQLGRQQLGENLLRCLENGISLHAFCRLILEDASYLPAQQLEEVVRDLMQDEMLPLAQRAKKQADTCLERQEYYRALTLYREMADAGEMQADREFLAQVYAQMGRAYAGLFHFEAAAQAFQKSFALFESEKTMEQYFFCQCFLLDREAYRKMAMENREYYELAVKARRVYENAAADERTANSTAETLEDARDEFRKMTVE